MSRHRGNTPTPESGANIMLSLRYLLEPPALEAEFRMDALESDKRLMSRLIVVGIVFLILSVPATFMLESDVAGLDKVWIVRAAIVAASAAALVALRHVHLPATYDAVVSIWTGAMIVALVGENSLFPVEWTDFISWDVFLTVAIYAAVPLPISRQAVLAGLMTVGDLLVLSTLKSPGPDFDTMDVVLAFACANVVGLVVARERHVLRRRAFVALSREVTVRKQLEVALHEVKTLQGILPICSFCKNIRTDAGEWQRVEAYVRDHSEARFSHGICPDCMKSQFAELVAS